MTLFVPLSDEVAVLQERLASLTKMLHRKRLRYVEALSRLELLAALKAGLSDTHANRSKQLAENLDAQADAYEQLANLEGTMRWIERARANLRSQLP